MNRAVIASAVMSIMAALLGCGGVAAPPSSPTTSGVRCGTNAFIEGGVCRCALKGATMMCGPNCVTLVDDPDNCGSCGHSCPATSACIRGQCGPQPRTLARSSGSCPTPGLAVAEGTLYWTSSATGDVNSVRIDGSAPGTLARGEPNPTLVAVAGSTLLWTTLTSGSAGDAGATSNAHIRSLALPGGAPQDLVSEQSELGILGLAVSDDGLTLYYSVNADVKAVPLAGGAAVVVAHQGRSLTVAGLAVEGQALTYVTTGAIQDVDLVTLADGVVATCGDGLGGGDPVNCARLGNAPGRILPRDVLLRRGSSYWAEGPRLSQGATVPSAFPSGNFIAESHDGTDIVALTRDADGVIFGGRGGMIERASFAPGGLPVVVARAPRAPAFLVTDAERIYWSSDDCSISALGPF